MALVSRSFVEETLWPEFREISETLRTYLSEVTERVVSEVIRQDSSEADVVEKPPKLSLVKDESTPVPAASTAPQGQSARHDKITPEQGVEGSLGNRSKQKRKRRRKRKRR